MLSKIEEKTKLLKNIESVDSLTINCLFNHRDPVLRAKNFSLAFNDRLLFQPITCEIFQGEQVALVGPNGSGKTTLLNYIINSNFYGTINGELTIPQGITKSIIRQHYNDNEGILKDFATAHHLDYTLFLQNLRILGVERDVFRIPIEKMSYGQMKKVEFSKSLGTPAEFFIWDEPLNYLDIFNQKQIESMIEQFKPTLLFVEHDQSFIANIATKIIKINPFS